MTTKCAWCKKTIKKGEPFESLLMGKFKCPNTYSKVYLHTNCLASDKEVEEFKMKWGR